MSHPTTEATSELPRAVEWALLPSPGGGWLVADNDGINPMRARDMLAQREAGAAVRDGPEQFYVQDADGSRWLEDLRHEEEQRTIKHEVRLAGNHTTLDLVFHRFSHNREGAYSFVAVKGSQEPSLVLHSRNCTLCY